MRDFAHRLMAYEMKENQSSDNKTPAAFQVCEKLRPRLATLMGTTGFRALLLRALALASTQAPGLGALRIKPDGSLEWLAGLETQVDTEEIAEGTVVLLVELFGLLVAFVGERLTLQLVCEIWPKVSLMDFDFGERR
jgi:hypothetical protein